MKCNRRNQKGFSLIELLVVVAIILIVAAIAIPNLVQARAAANQASAVGSLRTINTAMVMYTSSYPTVGFAPTLTALSGTTCTSPDETNACLIDSQLASGTKSGYSFSSINIGSAPASGYFAAGTPLSATGKSYCSTEDGVIHYDPSGNPIPDHDSCQALTPLDN